MRKYLSGAAVKQLREAKAMTQAELAEKLCVSAKTISKWETERGLPDISLLQPLAEALGVSVVELMSGDPVINRNISANLLRSRFYVCPVCGNVLYAVGDSVISCCGILLPPCEPDDPDGLHRLVMEPVEDELFLRFPHPMTKTHFISFAAYVTTDRVQLVKLYPEGEAQLRLQLRGRGWLYWYCNRHGLLRQRL